MSKILQIQPDGNTVLLDHFNGTVKGTGFGAVTYGESLPNLEQAVNLTRGAYIKYAFSPWYRWDGVHKWDRNEASSGVLTEGTIEMWIKPRQYSIVLLEFNWYDLMSSPKAGTILNLQLNTEGKMIYGGWGGNYDKAPVGKTSIPINKWTHIAVAWGPNGTKLYVNGRVDAYSEANAWPAFSGTVFAYLNHWGGNDLGLVDEFHVSKVARTDEEIRSRVQLQHPLENIPVKNIEGVGKVIAEKLKKQGIKKVKDLASSDVLALYKKVDIPMFKFYEIKRRATLALDIKIERALFDNILQMQLGEIIAMPDEELGRKANQPIEIISGLKKDISTLLVSLDNAVVKTMTLESVAFSDR
jgi:hypothetical protein